MGPLRLASCVPHATIWFDGACLGNPGPMGAGAVVTVGTQTQTVSRFLGRGTNNVAEYEAVLAGLDLATRMGATSATLRGDSQLVLRQLQGRYAVKAPALVPLHARAQQLLQGLRPVALEWIPREENARADALAKAAVEGKAP